MNFNLPDFIEFNKFLLVDELVLCNNPALIHYGKCSVIGYLLTPDCLGSIKIPNLQPAYQLPDCFLKLPLLMDFHPIEYLNTTVEIFGEVRLYDTTLASDNNDLESSHGLIQKLRNLQLSLEAELGLPQRPPSGTNDKSLHHKVKCRLLKQIDDFKKRYKAKIQVHTIRHIKDAREIIVENLNYRQIQTQRKSRLGLK